MHETSVRRRNGHTSVACPTVAAGGLSGLARCNPRGEWEQARCHERVWDLFRVEHERLVWDGEPEGFDRVATRTPRREATRERLDTLQCFIPRRYAMPWTGGPETMVTHMTFTEWMFSLARKRDVLIGYSVRVRDAWEL